MESESRGERVRVGGERGVDKIGSQDGSDRVGGWRGEMKLGVWMGARGRGVKVRVIRERGERASELEAEKRRESVGVGSGKEERDVGDRVGIR